MTSVYVFFDQCSHSLLFFCSYARSIRMSSILVKEIRKKVRSLLRLGTCTEFQIEKFWVFISSKLSDTQSFEPSTRDNCWPEMNHQPQSKQLEPAISSAHSTLGDIQIYFFKYRSSFFYCVLIHMVLKHSVYQIKISQIEESSCLVSQWPSNWNSYVISARALPFQHQIIFIDMIGLIVNVSSFMYLSPNVWQIHLIVSYLRSETVVSTYYFCFI